ncbi:MAG: PQQ-binding-like beta-propeller repeat protein [Planctomycetaceae bacterium]|nr:PQQ-binding-like beta-propeller repeat protein [Planctomycetales bacterium]MCB9923745.1 PQQ-binding-like beta-propeller repeat protein [Planctomycetaceae bacterium]
MKPSLIKFPIVFTIASTLALLSIVSAEDWPNWRGPNRNGVSDEESWRVDWPTTGPPIQWKANVGTGFSSVVVSKGRAFTVGNRDNTDTVFCLEADSGKVLWQHSYESPLNDKFFEGGPTATPTVDGERVFTLSQAGDLFCFAVTTGDILWSKNIANEADVRAPGWGFGGSPVVHDDKLLLAVGEAGTAVDKTTGELLWSSDDKDAGYATPHLLKHDGNWLMLVASGKYFHAVDVDTGQERWRHKWLTRFGCNAADPIVVAQTVFISSGYNRGSALLRFTAGEPEEVWKTKEYQNQFSSSVLLDGYLYGVDGDTTGERTLKCIELKTGEVQWSHEGFGSGALIAAGKRLIILSETGELVIADASPVAFRQVTRGSVLEGKCWTAPTLANGRVYCRSADGEVACVDLRP